MPKLHLVGITPDHKGLVLSEHARSKRGDLVLEIDERLVEAVEKAQRLRVRDEGHSLESNALPTKRDSMPGDGTAATRLSPREIQQRLRMGETVAALAKSSGVDEAWIERFAPPVLAEQARIVERARAITFTKGRLGASGVTLGPAVAANVIEKGVPLTLPEIEAGWAAYQRHDGTWCVSFSFSYRGRRQSAEWDLDPATKELAARNKLATDLAYREPGKKLPLPAAAPPVPAPAPASAARAPARAPAKAPAKPAKAKSGPERRQPADRAAGEPAAPAAVEALAADLALAGALAGVGLEAEPGGGSAETTLQTLPGTEGPGAAGAVTMAHRPGLAEVPSMPKPPLLTRPAQPAAAKPKARVKKTAKSATAQAPAVKKAAPAKKATPAKKAPAKGATPEARKAAPAKKVAAAEAKPSPAEEVVQVPEPPAAPVHEIPIVEVDESPITDSDGSPVREAGDVPAPPADEAPAAPADETLPAPAGDPPNGAELAGQRPGLDSAQAGTGPG